MQCEEVLDGSIAHERSIGTTNWHTCDKTDVAPLPIDHSHRQNARMACHPKAQEVALRDSISCTDALRAAQRFGVAMAGDPMLSHALV